jgi:hypothetical protein
VQLGQNGSESVPRNIAKFEKGIFEREIARFGFVDNVIEFFAGQNAFLDQDITKVLAGFRHGSLFLNLENTCVPEARMPVFRYYS